MWQTIRASALGRHVHEEAYAALVLSGGYEEAGDHGRFQVKAGNVVFHEQFEAHLDRFSETGAVVLNLRLPVGRSYTPGIARVADPDSVARVAERSCRDAVDLLFSVAMSRDAAACRLAGRVGGGIDAESISQTVPMGRNRMELRRGLYRGVSLWCLAFHQRRSVRALALAMH